MKAVFAAAACLALAAGCSFAQISAPPATTASKPTKLSAVNVEGLGTTSPVVGVNLYALHNYTAAQTQADGERMLSYIKNYLHADAVDIVWNFYVPNYQGNSVVTDSTTLSAANVGILTQIAQHEHLLVEYRPLMFLPDNQGSWEGHIKPSNPTQWFDSYYVNNLPYLQEAQKYHISEYVIGTEMNGVSPDPQWAGFLAKSAGIYHGGITYATDEYLYFPPRTQMPPTALTGVDMYEHINLPGSAPLSEVVAKYEHWFINVSPALLRQTAIQETGIPARASAYYDPANLGLAGVLDEEVQYNWFTAACETVKRFHMRGVFFWKVDLSDYPVTNPASSLSTFEGREGATAISQCESIIGG